MNQQLDTKLIENALALTWKSMEDMEIVSWVIYQKEELTYRFSIEKFCYYLLSKPFLSEYEPYYWVQFKDSMRYRVWHAFQEAITAYQDENEKLLVDLLEKLV